MIILFLREEFWIKKVKGEILSRERIIDWKSLTEYYTLTFQQYPSHAKQSVCEQQSGSAQHYRLPVDHIWVNFLYVTFEHVAGMGSPFTDTVFVM